MKTLLPTHLSSDIILDDFRQEVNLLSKLNHTCLVSFIGAGSKIDPLVRCRPASLLPGCRRSSRSPDDSPCSDAGGRPFPRPALSRPPAPSARLECSLTSPPPRTPGLCPRRRARR